MPVITVEGPAISTDAKRELVRRFTETAREVYRIEEIITVINRIQIVRNVHPAVGCTGPSSNVTSSF